MFVKKSIEYLIERLQVGEYYGREHDLHHAEALLASREAFVSEATIKAPWLLDLPQFARLIAETKALRGATLRNVRTIGSSKRLLLRRYHEKPNR